MRVAFTVFVIQTQKVFFGYIGEDIVKNDFGKHPI